jgi:hypothetical protein
MPRGQVIPGRQYGDEIADHPVIEALRWLRGSDLHGMLLLCVSAEGGCGLMLEIDLSSEWRPVQSGRAERLGRKS